MAVASNARTGHRKPRRCGHSSCETPEVLLQWIQQRRTQRFGPRGDERRQARGEDPSDLARHCTAVLSHPEVLPESYDDNDVEDEDEDDGDDDDEVRTKLQQPLFSQQFFQYFPLPPLLFNHSQYSLIW